MKFYQTFRDFFITIKNNGKIESKYMGSGEPKTADGNIDLQAFKKAVKFVETPSPEDDPLSEEDIARAGRSVYEALFPGQVGADFAAAYDETEREKKGLKILLNVPPECSGDGYPWEIARYKERFLSTYIRTPFLRVYPGKIEGIPLAEGKLPRVLSILSNVEAASGVDVKKEYENLDREIKKSRNFGGYLNVEPQGTSTSNPSLFDIAQVLTYTKTDPKAPPFNIIHFLAHGRENGQENVIILQPTEEEKRNGKSSITVTGKRLVESFKDEDEIGLIVLDACSSGKLYDNSKGLVPNLLDNFPAVVAMRTSISKDTAKEFTTYFYQSFTPQNVESVLQLTRCQMQLKSKTSIDFSIPIIYIGYNTETEMANTQIFTITQTPLKQWEPVANLSPHALTVLRLLKLHDDSAASEQTWSGKDEEKTQFSDAKIANTVIFGTFHNSLQRFSREIGACSTFPNAKSIWLKLCESLQKDMNNFSALIVEGDESKIQAAFDEFKQDYEALERLVARIATARKEEAC